MELKNKIKESRLEKDTLRKNEREVTHQMTLDALQEEIEDLRAESKNASRVFEAKLERYKKGNARLEKMNSTLESKLKEATTKLARLEKIREGSAVSNEKTNKELASLKEENATLKSMVTRLQERNKTLREKVDEAVRMANETEEKLVEATTPNFHVQPAFTERVSKYLNFRENNGVQIESYWADLYSRYGESITPFERQIRDAKTLREAQHAFMKIMPQVDKNLKAVQEASFMESDATHHMEQLKESGMKIDELNTLDAVNAAAKARMEAFGLE
jgi:predicted nuclease with TOPRIM domain